VPIIICPGFHAPQESDRFLAQMQLSEALLFPVPEFAPYSSLDLIRFLESKLDSPLQCEPVVFIAFSAGVVAATVAALTWQQRGGRVRALIALDGWGVPLPDTIASYRLSHDEFTHWSSALLGAGRQSFYCDPPVEHLKLWRSPATAWGWQPLLPGWRSRTTAAEFMAKIIDSRL